MQTRLVQWLVVAVLFGAAGWLTYREARSSRVLDEVLSGVRLALNGDSKLMDKPSELRGKVTCPGGTETEVVTYQKDGESAAAFAARHYELVAAVQAACPEE